MDKKFDKEIKKLLAQAYSKSLSEAIKRGIAEAKKRKNEKGNN